MSTQRLKSLRKPRMAIAIMAGILLSGVIVATVLTAPAPNVTLKLVEYKRWPSGAVLRLSNHSRSTIQCLVEPNGLPAGNPFLCLEQTSIGWTNRSLKVVNMDVYDPRRPAVVKMDLLEAVSPGSKYLTAPLVRDLKPGASTEFYIPLIPGGRPEKVGVVCRYPQRKLPAAVQAAVSHVKKWLRIKAVRTGEFEVWCRDVLAVNDRQEPLKLSESH